MLLGWLVLAWTLASFAADKLLGQSDLGTNEFSPQETPLIDGTIACRQHSSGHTAGPNWPTFLQFADRYFKEPVRKE
ncbi:MAG: hypothetical protein IAG10_07285 [Planctomycetaceae bacterium]|nr:hypothetical protein [Planctomycetaceae bacterium]